MEEGLSSLMDIAAEVEDGENDVEKRKKEQMGYYNTALNLYKATSLSLQAVSQKIRSVYNVPPHLSPNEVLQAKVLDLHNDVTLLNCLNDISQIIHQNYAYSNIIQDDNSLKSDLEKANDKILYFSESIMNLYGNYNELDQIQKGRAYIEILEYYQNHLDKLKSSLTKTANNDGDSSQLETCKRKIEKINTMRALKSILIAKFGNDGSRLPQLQEIRFSSRRNLTVEDFEETWDVCYK